MKRVYFLRPVGQIGPIKIGCSVQPEARLDTLTIWSPLRLEIITTAPGGHDREATLHGMFRKHHLHGEWFNACKELLALIDVVIATGELPDLPKVVRFPTKRRAPTIKAVKRPPGALREGEREEAEKYATAYREGMAAEQVASLFQQSAPRVRRLLIAIQCPMRKRGRPHPPQSLSDKNRARIDDIKARYVGGETLQQIGDAYGITRERIRQLLRKAGVPSLGTREEHRRQAHPLTALEMEAARLYDLGAGPTAVEEQTGVKRAQIYAILRRLNIERKGAGFFNRSPDYDERVEAVCRLYREGHGSTEIAKRLPFVRHPEETYKYLKRGGCPVRSPRIRKTTNPSTSVEVSV